MTESSLCVPRLFVFVHTQNSEQVSQWRGVCGVRVVAWRVCMCVISVCLFVRAWCVYRLVESTELCPT